MKNMIKLAAIAVAVAGSSVVAIGAAAPAFAADVVVQFDPGTVRYGYTDGYWDNSRTWHRWEQPSHIETYRAYKGARYYDYVHTRNPDQGWIVETR